MNRAEVSELLSYAAGLDRWLQGTDPETAGLMLVGWGDLLADVPLDQAIAYTRWHYGQPAARTLQPGDVVSWWAAGQREAAREAAEAEGRELVTAGGQGELIPAPSVAAYLRATQAAVAAGGSVDDVPLPEGLGKLTLRAEVWSRRCVYHELCACEHRECRDGWLDEEEVRVNGLGKRYPAARRCRHCNDALLMAIERGIAKKPKGPAPVRRRA